MDGSISCPNCLAPVGSNRAKCAYCAMVRRGQLAPWTTLGGCVLGIGLALLAFSVLERTRMPEPTPPASPAALSAPRPPTVTPPAEPALPAALAKRWPDGTFRALHLTSCDRVLSIAYTAEYHVDGRAPRLLARVEPPQEAMASGPDRFIYFTNFERSNIAAGLEPAAPAPGAPPAPLSANVFYDPAEKVPHIGLHADAPPAKIDSRPNSIAVDARGGRVFTQVPGKADRWLWSADVRQSTRPLLWKPVRDLDTKQYTHLVHAPRADALYGLPFEGDLKVHLTRIPLAGGPLERIVLKPPLAAATFTRIQLAMVGDDVAIVTYDEVRDVQGIVAGRRRLSVYDPKSGERLHHTEIAPPLDPSRASIAGDLPADAEVHAISAFDLINYQGLPVPAQRKVAVHVSRRGAPLVLVLGGRERYSWRLTTDPGVQIHQVILTSDDPPDIAGVPLNRVVAWTPKGSRSLAARYPEQNKEFFKALTELGLKPRSFQAGHMATPFTIDDSLVDPSLPPRDAELVVLDVTAIRPGQFATQDDRLALRRYQVPVSRAGHPLVLALSSDVPAEWTFAPAPNVQIERVILTGDGLQSVRGLPARTRVIHKSMSHHDGAPLMLGAGSRPAELESKEATRQLQPITGLIPSLILGRIGGTTFRID